MSKSVLNLIKEINIFIGTIWVGNGSEVGSGYNSSDFDLAYSNYGIRTSLLHLIDILVGYDKIETKPKKNILYMVKEVVALYKGALEKHYSQRTLDEDSAEALMLKIQSEIKHDT